MRKTSSGRRRYVVQHPSADVTWEDVASSSQQRHKIGRSHHIPCNIRNQHELSFSWNTKVWLTFRFLAETMSSPMRQRNGGLKILGAEATLIDGDNHLIGPGTGHGPRMRTAERNSLPCVAPPPLSGSPRTRGVCLRWGRWKKNTVFEISKENKDP